MIGRASVCRERPLGDAPEGSGHVRGTPVLPAARHPVTPLLETRGPRGATSKRVPCAGRRVHSHGHRESRLPLTSRPEEPRETTTTGDVRPHPVTRAGKQPARQRGTHWDASLAGFVPGLPPREEDSCLVSPWNPSTDTPGSLTHNSPRQDAAREPSGHQPVRALQNVTGKTKEDTTALRQGHPGGPLRHAAALQRHGENVLPVTDFRGRCDGLCGRRRAGVQACSGAGPQVAGGSSVCRPHALLGRTDRRVGDGEREGVRTSAPRSPLYELL